MHFGSALRAARRRQGLTQVDLAKSLGTNQTAISYAENSAGIALSETHVQMAFVMLGWPDDLLAAWAQCKQEELDRSMERTLEVLNKARSLRKGPDILTKLDALLRKQQEFREELERFADELRAGRAEATRTTVVALQALPAGGAAQA